MFWASPMARASPSVSAVMRKALSSPLSRSAPSTCQSMCSLRGGCMRTLPRAARDCMRHWLSRGEGSPDDNDATGPQQKYDERRGGKEEEVDLHARAVTET